jgi:hypothetical protein
MGGMDSLDALKQEHGRRLPSVCIRSAFYVSKISIGFQEYKFGFAGLLNTQQVGFFK